jgi:hypothetical protein
MAFGAQAAGMHDLACADGPAQGGGGGVAGAASSMGPAHQDTSAAANVHDSRTTRGMCTLTAAEATAIFKARAKRWGKQDGLAAKLGAEYAISPKAVRDIWNLRTWADTTRPLWIASDYARFFAKAGSVLSAPQVSESTGTGAAAAAGPHRHAGYGASDGIGASDREPPERGVASEQPEPATMSSDMLGHLPPSDGVWKLEGAWLAPGEELRHDEFDRTLACLSAAGGGAGGAAGWFDLTLARLSAAGR